MLRFLVEECGVRPDRIYAASFGETLPLSSNPTPDGRASNRRVETVILPGSPASS